MSARLAVDIGGTFTDFVLSFDDGTVHRLKLPSTPHDYAEAIGRGLDRLLGMADLPASGLAEVLHATTIASNAIIEGNGGRTGLITTRGFRDILEIRTLRMPRLYDLHWQKPPPLVERALRREVEERLDASGAVRTPLDEASVVAALAALVEADVETIAVCLLHAYANDVHERRVAELARSHAPGVRISLSADVLPEIREYERTSTTVMNAYLQPVVAAYLERLRRLLADRAVAAPLLLMQSAGGLMPASLAARRPVSIVESGPAAGVIGAIALGAESGIRDLISFDMGGTTAKAALVAQGEASRAAEFQVGGGVMTGSRLLTGSGYTLRVPAIDLAEVGAGGGSVVWLDAAGVPQVGPRSAGAVPGPVCYRQGGTEPTITDCNLLLGWLNPAGLAGGTIPLDPESAAAAVETHIAAPLRKPVAVVAYGAVEVATATMIRAIRAVSSERGVDPRGHALVAFGGNGGIFGPLVAQRLGIRRVVIPPSPGLFSATGLLDAVIEHEVVRTHKVLLAAAEAAAVNALLAALAEAARAELAEAGAFGGDIAVQRQARLRYQGQSFELAVPLPDGALDQPALLALAEAFGAEHQRTYGHRAGADEPTELVNLVVRLRVRPTVGGRRPVRSAAARMRPAGAARRAYFGPVAGWQEVSLLERADLAGAPLTGPLIIEEYDATIVVPPGVLASLDATGNVVLDLPSGP
jgi:N-methylhydantoinase A